MGSPRLLIGLFWRKDGFRFNVCKGRTRPSSPTLTQEMALERSEARAREDRDDASLRERSLVLDATTARSERDAAIAEAAALTARSAASRCASDGVLTELQRRFEVVSAAKAAADVACVRHPASATDSLLSLGSSSHRVVTHANILIYSVRHLRLSMRAISAQQALSLMNAGDGHWLQHVLWPVAGSDARTVESAAPFSPCKTNAEPKRTWSDTSVSGRGVQHVGTNAMLRL